MPVETLQVDAMQGILLRVKPWTLNWMKNITVRLWRNCHFQTAKSHFSCFWESMQCKPDSKKGFLKTFLQARISTAGKVLERCESVCVWVCASSPHWCYFLRVEELTGSCGLGSAQAESLGSGSSGWPPSAAVSCVGRFVEVNWKYPSTFP